MSRTDKTDPYKIRHNKTLCDCEYAMCTCGPREGKFWTHKPFSTNAEMLIVGPKGIRFVKRIAHKKNRRARVPLARMSGFGWGYQNYRYCLSD